MSELFYLFENNFWLLSTTVVFVGLCVGSFLNVVAYRLPIMLENDWREQCNEFLEINAPETATEQTTFNLATPASTCPSCGHKIRAYENIPLISYLLLMGKCSSCKTSISIRYPIVEFITAVATLVVVQTFGVTPQAGMALLFTWILIALTLIDLDKQLLPDNLTLPLLWLGLLVSIWELFVNSHASIIGAIAGYLIFWVVFIIFKKITGKEGMGYGDFKLLSALGAWCGWQLIPQIILISSILGTIIGITMIATKLTERSKTIPFGPYLAIAGWIALLWGNEINQWYLHGIN